MVHNIVFSFAAGWITLLLVVCVILVIRGESTLDRVLAFDLLTLIVIGIFILLAYQRSSPHYLDAALVLALLSFVSTVAAARFESEGKIFS